VGQAGGVQWPPLHMVLGSVLHATPHPPQLYGSFVGSMHVVPQHVRPLVHVPVAEHGPPPLSGTPASEPPLDEPPELPPDDPLEPPLEDPLPPLDDDPLPLPLEEEPLLDPEPPDDPPDPDSAEASELPSVEPDPPQATIDENQTTDAPRSHACFKQAAIVSSLRRRSVDLAAGGRHQVDDATLSRQCRPRRGLTENPCEMPGSPRRRAAPVPSGGSRRRHARRWAHRRSRRDGPDGDLAAVRHRHPIVFDTYLHRARRLRVASPFLADRCRHRASAGPCGLEYDGVRPPNRAPDA
jgi:hypothetical protein